MILDSGSTISERCFCGFFTVVLGDDCEQC